MIEIEKALAAMRTIPQDFSAARHATPLADPAAHLRPLAAELQRLQETIDSGAPPKAPMDPLTVWRKWERTSFAHGVLDRREWRSLCVSPETAGRLKLIASLQSDASPLYRLSTLMGFTHVYFSLWRELEEPQAMESLIMKVLDHPDIRSRGRVVACWRESRFLFTEHANARLAEHIVLGSNKPDSVREEFFLQNGAQ